jgi:hypothetical protein
MYKSLSRDCSATEQVQRLYTRSKLRGVLIMQGVLHAGMAVTAGRPVLGM